MATIKPVVPATNIPAVKAKKPKPPRKTQKAPAAHPKYQEMIVEAVKSLKERGGSSRIAIIKYIAANFKLGNDKVVNTHVKLALKRGVATGVLTHVKGQGASGSFKLSVPTAGAPKIKKATTKKVPAKKAVGAGKKSPKKPKAKKSPKKSPLGKKPVSAETPKKPATAETPKPTTAETPKKATVKKSVKAASKPLKEKSPKKKLATKKPKAAKSAKRSPKKGKK